MKRALQALFAGSLFVALAAPSKAADYPVNVWYGMNGGGYFSDFGRISPYNTPQTIEKMYFV